MHFIFLTRCSSPNNIFRIKDNLKYVFSQQNLHTYLHIIIVDLTNLKLLKYFLCLKDLKTSLYFVHNKTKDDKYITKGVDLSIANINKEAYCYMLDDDNLIRDNFLDICSLINYETDDVVIFKTEGIAHLGNKDFFNYANAIGCLDWSNFLTKLSVAQKVKFYNGVDSFDADGRFINKILKTDYKIKFSYQIIANYNAISKP